MRENTVRKIEMFTSTECEHCRDLIDLIDATCTETDKRDILVSDVLDIPEHELHANIKWVPTMIINDQYATPKVGDECFRFVSLFYKPQATGTCQKQSQPPSNPNKFKQASGAKKITTTQAPILLESKSSAEDALAQLQEMRKAM